MLLGSGGGSSSTDAPKQLEAAGCTVQTVTALPSGDHSVLTPERHVEEVEHVPADERSRTTRCRRSGARTPTPLLPAQVVHNLEHGGIFIQYGKDVPQATVDQLQGVLRQHQNGTLLAPLPSLGSKIALGRLDDEQRLPARHRHGVPREVHDVRREGVCGVLQGVPVQGPRALPGELADARHVARRVSA